jgi:DNA-binding NarL/FixJ family response regulator
MNGISELCGWPRTFHRNIGFEAMDGKVPDRPDLSREENELLRLLADGMSTRQIAVELKISERSAQVLIPKILRKLGRGPDLGQPPGSDV